MRWRRQLVIGLLIAAAMAALWPSPAAALSDVRRQAVACMLHAAGLRTLVHDPHDDITRIPRCYRRAGIRIDALWRNPMDLAGLETIPIGPGSPRPEPGDLAAWLGIQDGVLHLGMVLDEAQIIALDNKNYHGYCIVPRAQIDDATGYPEGHQQEPWACTTKPYAAEGTLRILHLPPRLFPGGIDDANPPPGHIALVDPAEAASLAGWAAWHPVDADRSPWHLLLYSLAQVFSDAQHAVGMLGNWLSAFADLVWNHKWLIPLLPLAAVIKLLSLQIDMRALHHWLSLLLLPLLFPGSLLCAGLSRLHLPLLSAAAGRAYQWQLQLVGGMITFFTGIEGERQSSLGGVFISLVTLPALVIKPLLGARLLESAAGRLGRLTPHFLGRATGAWERLAAGTESTLGFAVYVKGGLTLRPSTWEAAYELTEETVSGTPTWRWARRARGMARLGDLLSVVWRPNSAAPEALRLGSDYLPHALAEFQGSHSGNLRRIVDSIRNKLLPALRGARKGQHLRAGANVITDALNGQGPAGPDFHLRARRS